MDARLRRLGSNTRIKILKAPLNGTPKIWLAGRANCCHIYTQSKYASRKHFSITYRENKYYISDLQSSNGTFVDDNKITSEKILSCGNVISVGVPLNVPETPDVVIYVFEILSVLVKKPANKDDDICIIDETIETSEKPIYLTQGTDPKKNEVNINEDQHLIHLDEDCIKFDNEYSETCKKNNEVEETAGNTSLNEVIVIAASNKSLKRCLNSSSPELVPAKIQKFEELEETIESFEESKKTYDKQSLQNEGNCILDEKDMEVYEALTQIDKPEVKTEKSSLNYSGTEELIEISDCEEEDWSFKSMEKNKCDELPEGEEDDGDGDDDVVFIERIIKSKSDDDLLSLCSKIKDDLTETDKKWMGKLLKVKHEHEPLSESQSKKKIQSVEITEEYSTVHDGSLASGGVLTPGEDPSRLSVPAAVLIPHCVVKLQQISEDHFCCGESKKTAESFREQEKTFQKSSKKRVSFDLNPRVKYYEIPERVTFTTAEKGMMIFNKVIFNICNWNTVWLEECKRVASEKDPPDICDAPLRKIPKKFTSHTDYTSSYVPLMLLHLWNKVRDKWKNFGEAAFKQTLSFDSCEDYHAENLWLFKCTGLVQSVEAHLELVKEGHLVMLRLHPIRGANVTVASSKYFKKVGYLVFGYLKAKTYERFYDQSVHEALRERCSSARGDLHLVRLTILVKKRQRLEIDKQKLMQMTVVQNISSDMRIFRAICFLPLSPLFKTILRPSRTKFILNAASEKTEVFFTGPLDKHQKELVSNLTHAFFSKDSFLFSIHGAAGTGKSQVVVAFILELLCGKESKKIGRPKIIYCAPSDGPLDEMVARLKSCRESLDVSSRFSMARVGPIKGVKPEVREFALTNLTQKYQSLKQAIKSGRNEDPEVEVLEKSDLICATCSPTGMKKIIWVFNKRLNRNSNQKTVCIIDEANNIRESDSLLPLLLGVTHMLLVGDVHQLDPPVSGEKTRFLGLDMSLFGRIYRNFEFIPKDLRPMSILKTQYRMSPGLSRFTGNVIYNALLQDSVASASHKIPSLRSYLVVVNETPDVDPQSIEIQEGRIVFELVKAVLKVTKEDKEKALNLSVITSDSMQTAVIQSFMPKRKFPEVEISQLQKYQGRETDVVVFSCDGTKLFVSQIAVAITRAKSSLFVVTTQRSISSNPLCQKLAQLAEEKRALKHIRPDSEPEIFERVIAE